MTGDLEAAAMVLWIAVIIGYVGEAVIDWWMGA